MPELPEVELVKRSLTSLIGLEIKDVVLSQTVIDVHKNNRLTIVKESIDHILKVTNTKSVNKNNRLRIVKERINDFLKVKNTKMVNIKRSGKLMYFELINDDECFYMISHPGMSGGFFIVDNLDEITERNYKNTGTFSLS